MGDWSAAARLDEPCPVAYDDGSSDVRAPDVEREDWSGWQGGTLVACDLVGCVTILAKGFRPPAGRSARSTRLVWP